MKAPESSRATFYRDKKKAVSLLGVILWGFIIPDVLRNLKGEKTLVNR